MTRMQDSKAGEGVAVFGYVRANTKAYLVERPGTPVVITRHPLWPNDVPLYAHPSPAVPVGYKLAPIEPTEEMIKAGVQYARAEFYYANEWRFVVGAIYKAVLEASPSLPQQEVT